MFHHENMEGMLRKADEQVKALVEENERVVSELKVLSNVRNEQLGTDVYFKWSSPKSCGLMPHVQLFMGFWSLSASTSSIDTSHVLKTNTSGKPYKYWC